MKRIIVAILLLSLSVAAFALLLNKSDNDQSTADNRKPESQLELQYETKVESPYKRVLSFDAYALDAFEEYDKVHELVHGKDIVSIQSSLFDGLFTMQDLVQYYLTRVKNFADYNAVIQLNPEILSEAQAIDVKIASGEKRSLYGVVILIKDNIAASNMNTSTGAYALKDLTTTRDAVLVKNLKSEGALILGKANLSEWSNFMTIPSSNGYSALGGQTKNAYGPFDVGGSSSGPAVAAALGLSTVTVGTETSGSLIYPSGQNSVLALKPTLGLLSRDLIIPISEAQDTAGVVCRKKNDLNISQKKNISFIGID